MKTISGVKVPIVASGLRRIVFVLAVVLTLASCVIFTACNENDGNTQNPKYDLYIQAIEFDENNLVMSVVVSLDPSERELPCKAKYFRNVKQDGSFWKIYTTFYTINCDALLLCVENAISEGERNYNSNYYSDLKIVFDYATIYKSTSSDGEIIIEGKKFHHRFAVKSTGEQTVTLNRRSPNTAAWYGVLISVGLAVTFAVAAVSAAVGGKNGRQRQA